MAIHDYRFNPFENTFDIKKIFDEPHVIPSNSPYTIRLTEVPQKTSPTTLQVKFQNGNLMTEVAEEPAQGKGKGCKHADPADLPIPKHRAQAEIYAHCHGDRQQCEQQLPQGQPEE